MSQQYQGIGTPSSELEAVAGEKQGWQNAPDIQNPVEEQTDATDYSFYDNRSNYQGLGLQIPSMAGYQQPNMAGYPVQPVDGRERMDGAAANKSPDRRPVGSE